ncbi:MAG: PAP OAS1 substrate-binding domain-containing protein [Lasallia pustulata]|uniref:polynucleotide adenylyltransferase n=1 Tax=Lasallia pustulata TaxID=136370 RepID=A0A5M8PVT2_9LECA|nr:MAG: PAP OAS1 substrate-binding domain-containing protein [Lasallia pustulata]
MHEVTTGGNSLWQQEITLTAEMDLNQANLPAAAASADKTVQSVNQPAMIASSHDSGVDNSNDLERRIRSMILNNAIPQKQTDIVSNPAAESSDPPLAPLPHLLPPHMRLATLDEQQKYLEYLASVKKLTAEQQEYLASVKKLTNVSNVPSPSTRTQASTRTAWKRPNQAQRRQFKVQFELQPSQDTMASNPSRMPPRSLNATGVPYQTSNPTNQQALPVQQQGGSTRQRFPLDQHQIGPPQQQNRSIQQQVHPNQQQVFLTQVKTLPQKQARPVQKQGGSTQQHIPLGLHQIGPPQQQGRPAQQQTHPTQQQFPLAQVQALPQQQASPPQRQVGAPQQQAGPPQQQVGVPQRQNRPASQQPVPRQLQGPLSQQRGRLAYQQDHGSQQPLTSSSSGSNRPFLMTAHDSTASSCLTPGYWAIRSGNLYNPQRVPRQPGGFARNLPRERQLYQRLETRPLGHPPNQSDPSYNPFSPDAIQAQVNYLNQLAGTVLPAAEMDDQSLQDREDLRLLLQRICRSAIRDYERQKFGIFDEGSVGLLSIGSVRSGFATQGSDLDLALISPFSRPDVASPDSEIPRILEKALLDLGYGARLLTKTRVPIIKFCEKPTPELADALRKARAKWEMERDAPPKPEVARSSMIKKDKLRLNANEISEQGNLRNATGATDGDVIEQSSDSEIAQTLPLTEPPAVDVSSDEDLTLRLTKDAKGKSRIYTNEPGKSCTTPAADVQKGKEESEIPQTLPLTEPPAVDVSSDEELTPKISKEAKGKSKEYTDEPEKSRTKPPADAQEGKEEGGGSGEEELPHRSDEELIHLYQLAISEGWFDEEERKLVSHFAWAVEQHGSDGDHIELVAARHQLETLSHVLKRYREPPDRHLDFPKGGIGIQCDINFSNHLAVHNTQLLRCYCYCDPRVSFAVLFVKVWAKRRKINSPYHGTLSSYGYVLMVLHYLVNIVQPPLVPNLQLAWKPPKRSEKGEWTEPVYETTANGYDVRFWRSEEEIEEVAHSGKLTQCREIIGSLLRGFFHYFALNGPFVPFGGFSWTQQVLSLRTQGGLLSKQDKGWTSARKVIIEPTAAGQQGHEVRHRYLFAIEDPFEIDHNIARTVTHDGIVAIRDEFRRAHRIIQSAGKRSKDPIEDLFAEGQEKETRPRRAFGPLPPPPPARKKEPASTSGPATGDEQTKIEPTGEERVDASAVGGTGPTNDLDTNERNPGS